jgi:CDP-glucose 4,6-dehydratase
VGFRESALEGLVMESRPGFFRDKSVLVTGHTGFKGAWLSEWLLRLGARVVGYALPPDQTPSLYTLFGLAERLHSVLADVRDQDALARVMAESRPEIVFHLAAQPLVRRSYREPVATLATNVMGTAHLLEAVRKTDSVRSVVIVTSDKCYENVGSARGYRESDPMGGHDPYSASKAAAELVTAAYRRSFFSGPGRPGVASARAGNVIGGGDWSEDRLVPDLVRGIARGEAVVIRNPASIRPWQHVLEPLAGYLMLARSLYRDPARCSDGFNFGPAEADLPVGVLARRFVEALGSGTLAAPPPGDQPHEASVLLLDSTKAREVLGWTPRLGIEDTIELTVDWYREHQKDPASARAVTERQLALYEARLGEHAP